MRIDRFLINPDVSYNGLSINDLDILIDKWKFLLVDKYQAKQNDTLALAIMEVNANHLALIFAVAELGMKLFLIDKPVSDVTLHMTKLGIFGPVRFGVECATVKDLPLHHKMMETFCKTLIDENEVDDIQNYDCYDIPEDINFHTPFLRASTSGTTGRSKEYIYSHGEVMFTAKRNKSVFKFEEDSCVLHMRNMHHASSILSSLFPSLMVSKNHYSVYPFVKGSANVSNETLHTIVTDVIVPKSINRVLCGSMFDVIGIMEGLKEVELTVPLLLNISGFSAPKELYDATKTLPIEFISHYGAVGNAGPLLVNYIHKNSEFKENYLGIPSEDGLYVVNNTNGVTTVYSDMWKEIRPLTDNLVNEADGWYFVGRKENNVTPLRVVPCDHTVVYDDNRKYLAIWDASYTPTPIEGFDAVIKLDKQTFTVDTKINMDQLRAYFRCL